MPTKSPSQQALNDILEAFDKQFDIGFTTAGLQTVITLFDGSLGNFLRDLEPHNRGVDIWGDTNLRELPNFILGFVVAQIAVGIIDAAGPSNVDDKTVRDISSAVMTDPKTEKQCEFVVKSYLKKVKHDKAQTPICSTQPFQR